MAITIKYHLWAQQLQLEFEQICLLHRIDLQCPVFEITEAKMELGAWCGETRSMRVSRHLIANYSWAVTQQVLKHEMAHQLCQDYFSSQDKAHGTSFQQACDLLGVLPQFRNHKIALQEVGAESVAGPIMVKERSRVLQKIEKLLSLARSDNVHEAELALQKANELMAKHHVSQLLGGGETLYTFIVINRKRKQIPAYVRYICMILQEFFFVQVVLSQLYDPERHDSFKTVEIYGTREKVAVAEYCFYFLENQIDGLWERNKKHFRDKRRSQKRSFSIGLMKGFHQQLSQQRQDPTLEKNQEQRMLVLREKGRLEQFVAMRYPKLSRRSYRTGNLFGDSYHKGIKEGRNLSFTEGVTSSDEQSRLLPYLKPE